MSMLTGPTVNGWYFFNSPIKTEVLGILKPEITGVVRVRGSSPLVVLDNLTQLFLRGGYEI